MMTKLLSGITYLSNLKVLPFEKLKPLGLPLTISGSSSTSGGSSSTPKNIVAAPKNIVATPFVQTSTTSVSSSTTDGSPLTSDGSPSTSSGSSLTTRGSSSTPFRVTPQSIHFNHKNASFVQHTLSFMLFFLFFIGITIHPSPVFAQDNETGLKFDLILDIYVTKEDKKTPLPDTKIVITQGATVIVQDEVGVDGHNSFNIPLNKGNFVITISKAGYITKKVNVKSKVPKYNDNYEWGFAIDLFQKVDPNKVGTKYFTYLKNQKSEFVLGGEILDQPVSTIFFDPTIKEFNYDKTYAAWMQQKIAELSQAQKADLIADAEAKANGKPLPSIAKKAAEAKAKTEAAAKTKKAEEDAKEKEKQEARAKAEAKRITNDVQMALEKQKRDAAAYNEAERLRKEEEAKKLQANKETKSEYLAKIDEAVAEAESKKKQEQFDKQEDFEQLKREANEKAMLELLKMQQEERYTKNEKVRNYEITERKIKENKRIKYESSNPFKDLMDAAAEYEVAQKKKALQKK